MSDWKLSEAAWQERRDEAADEYTQSQRQAFLDGFEAAVREAEEFRQLRNWLEDRRDHRAEENARTDNSVHLAMRMAYTNVLVKLSEVGCRSEDGQHGE